MLGIVDRSDVDSNVLALRLADNDKVTGGEEKTWICKPDGAEPSR